jgi:hypothetical protein
MSLTVGYPGAPGLCRMGGRRQSDAARRMTCADAGGVHRVVQRLEARAAQDAALAKKREDHRRTLSEVKRWPRCFTPKPLRFGAVIGGVPIP